MRKILFSLGLIVVLLGIMGNSPPVSAIPPEDDELPLYDDIFGNRIGNIVIDPDNTHYATFANVGEQNGKLYYELKAYNPSGFPMTITWGMVQANMNGHLRFNGKFDSITLAWIKRYGLSGATYTVRPL